MKKLKLSLQNIEGAEVLSREQLKKVVGGDGGSSTPCKSNSDCEKGERCFNVDGKNQCVGWPFP